MGREEGPFGRPAPPARLITTTETARPAGLGKAQRRKYVVSFVADIATGLDQCKASAMRVIRSQTIATDRLPSVAVDAIAGQVPDDMRAASPSGMRGPAQGHGIDIIRRFCACEWQGAGLDASARLAIHVGPDLIKRLPIEIIPTGPVANITKATTIRRLEEINTAIFTDRNSVITISRIASATSLFSSIQLRPICAYPSLRVASPSRT